MQFNDQSRWTLFSGQWLGGFIWRNYSVVNQGLTWHQQPLLQPRAWHEHQTLEMWFRSFFGIHYKSVICSLGGPVAEQFCVISSCFSSSFTAQLASGRSYIVMFFSGSVLFDGDEKWRRMVWCDVFGCNVVMLMKNKRRTRTTQQLQRMCACAPDDEGLILFSGTFLLWSTVLKFQV